MKASVAGFDEKDDLDDHEHNLLSQALNFGEFAAMEGLGVAQSILKEKEALHFESKNERTTLSHPAKIPENHIPDSAHSPDSRLSSQLKSPKNLRKQR